MRSTRTTIEARRTGSAHLLAAAAIALLATPPPAAAAAQKLCFSQVTGLPHKNANPPPTWTFPANPPNLTVLNDPSGHPVDPDADSGWFNAYRLSHLKGADVDGTLQAIAQTKMLYFSFKLYNDQVLDSYDSAVIAFDNKSATQRKYTWIVLQPFAAIAGTETNVSPTAVDPNWINVYTATTDTNGQPNWGFAPSTGWLKAVFAATSAPSQPKTWYLVVSIDNSDPNGPALPLTGSFGIVLDGVPTSSDMARQVVFPTKTPGGNPFGVAHPTVPDTSNPPPADWGEATLGAGCSGVYFTWAPWKPGVSLDITNSVNGQPTPLISWTQANQFAARLHNSGDAPAQQVAATFRIANHGLPADREWLTIGTNPLGPPKVGDTVGNNPTPRVDVPAHDVNGTGQCTDPGGGHESNHDGCIVVRPDPWTLGTDNVAYYSQPGQADECIRVDLDSTSGATFINDSGWNNFNFAATASKFVSPRARVSGDHPPAANAAPDAPQVFDLLVVQRPLAPVKTGAQAAVRLAAGERATNLPDKGPDRIVSAVEVVVHGCRHTGTFVTVDPPKGTPGNPPTKKFESCDMVGSYGYGITHVGDAAVKSWNVELSSPDQKLTRLPSGALRLLVPQGKGMFASVVTTVTPEIPGSSGFAVFLDAGAAIPSGGTFGSSFDTGFGVNGGLEYAFHPNIAAEVIGGYHRFPAKAGSDLSVYQLSANAKVYGPQSWPVQPFVNGGVGMYWLDPGSSDTGFNAGAGVLRRLGPQWGLQASYNFHSVNTSGGATKFSTAQLGVRYAF